MYSTPMDENEQLRLEKQKLEHQVADLKLVIEETNNKPFNVGKSIDIKVEKKGGKLKPTPLSQLLTEYKPSEWVVDLFGAKGACVLLAGDKGSGKSALMYRMAESISNGSVFMGNIETQKSKVFVWQADESRNNAQLKFKMMDLKGDISFLFSDDDNGDLLDIGLLKNTIQSEGIEVVFIDSITGLLMGKGISIKDSEFSTPLYHLNNLASELNVLIIISAHLTKEDRSEVHLNDILGAGTQSGAVSDIWGLWTDEKIPDKFYLKCLGKRNCEKGIYWTLDGNKEDFSFELISSGTGELMPDERKTLRYKFLNYLIDIEEKTTAGDLAIRFKCNAEHARRICTQLFQEEKVYRVAVNNGIGKPFYKYWADSIPTLGI